MDSDANAAAAALPAMRLRDAFPALTESEVAALAAQATTGRYAAGATIVREGERGSRLYVVGQGEVEIAVHTEDGEAVLVDTAGPPTYFGEMAFFGESIRTATIRALTECHTVELEQVDFMAVARANPALLQTLLAQIIGHLRRNDRAVIRELNARSAVLQDAIADLAEQETLRSQFIATLAHELRTPLTAVQGFLGLINQGAIAGESLQVALRAVTRNVAQLVSLTNNMLLLYEMSPGPPDYAYHAPADIVVAALNRLQSGRAGGPAPVRLDIADNLPEIHADRQGLEQAIQALIENGVKFTPDNTPVRIRVSSPEPGEVAIEVADQGIGIPEEDQARIFEPFFRLEQMGAAHLFPGLGIGLTIARLMVERHHGRIEVESRLGAGSTFTMRLPVA